MKTGRQLLPASSAETRDKPLGPASVIASHQANGCCLVNEAHPPLRPPAPPAPTGPGTPPARAARMRTQHCSPRRLAVAHTEKEAPALPRLPTPALAHLLRVDGRGHAAAAEEDVHTGGLRLDCRGKTGRPGPAWGVRADAAPTSRCIAARRANQACLRSPLLHTPPAIPGSCSSQPTLGLQRVDGVRVLEEVQRLAQRLRWHALVPSCDAAPQGQGHSGLKACQRTRLASQGTASPSRLLPGAA